jgi:hypothetical protein
MVAGRFQVTAFQPLTFFKEGVIVRRHYRDAEANYRLRYGIVDQREAADGLP